MERELVGGIVFLARESRKVNCSWNIESGGGWEVLMRLHR